MAGYLINKSHRDDSVVSIKEIDGYTFKPKQGKGNYIKVNVLTTLSQLIKVKR